MKKNVKKVVLIILLLLSIFLLISPKVYGADSISSIFTKADNFINQKDSNTITISEESLQDMSKTLYNVLLIIGIILAVIIGMILGIKFMTGSIEEKAKVKETLIPYVAGCIVIFGAFTIWKVVVEVLQSAPSA